VHDIDQFLEPNLREGKSSDPQEGPLVAGLIERDAWSSRQNGPCHPGLQQEGRAVASDAPMREARVQSHAQTSLPAVKITTPPMRKRKIETARSLCYLNSLKPSLSREAESKAINEFQITHHGVPLWLACVRRIAKLLHHIEGEPRSSSAPLRAR
jgi:hypothetical protein